MSDNTANSPSWQQEDEDSPLAGAAQVFVPGAALGTHSDPRFGDMRPAPDLQHGGSDGGIANGYGSGRTQLIAQNYDSTDGRWEFSDNQDIDAVLIGSRWTLSNLTFSFPTSGDFYTDGTDSYYGEEADNHVTFNAAQQTATRYALGLVSSYTNLTFTEVNETSNTHANLRLSQTNEANVSSAYGNFPSSSARSGDIWLGRTGQPFYTTPAVGNWGQATIMHELGHTLGLKHGQDDYTFVNLAGEGYLDGGVRYGSAALPSNHDGQSWSLMTYRSAPGQPITFEGEGSNQPQTYMQNDILALQYLYGANYNFNSGDSVYRWSTTTGEMTINGVGQGAPTANIILRTIWDGNGVDTYDLSNYATNLTIDLRPGAFSTFSAAQLANHRAGSGGNAPAAGNIANALLFAQDSRSLIENATGGSGADTITGNQAGNLLRGNAGADTLNGGIGNDILIGGLGGDRLDGGSGNDMASYREATSGVTASLLTNTGTGGVHAIGDTFVSIEWLEGSNYGDSLSGDNSGDVLYGIGGNDILFGNDGSDELYGGAGSDVLNGGTGGDYLDGGADFDTAAYTSAVTINLATGSHGGGAAGDVFVSIERFAGSGFADTLIGNESGNNFLGLGGNDTLTGNGGDDMLEGGAGGDRLDGGSGTDTASYESSSAGVTVDLSIGKVFGGDAQGDTLVSIENLFGSDHVDSLVGNDVANNIQGGFGDDNLYGRGGSDIIGGDFGSDDFYGGTGADYMDGGEGSDWAFYGESTVGVRLEYDASAGKILGSGGEAEGDTLVSIENIVGTAYADTLIGSPDDNILRGGSGGDYLDGGIGNDTLDYRGSSAGVRINLLNGTATGGTATGDTIVRFENVIGSGYDDVLNGNRAANVLNGGAGNDVFGGEGGGDTHIGGLGDDTFYLNSDDRIVELADQGTDRLIFYYGGPTYSLGAGIAVEIMEMADATTTARNLVGNEFDQTLSGNAAGNVLNGRGGSDTATYAASNAGIIIALDGVAGSGGTALGDRLFEIENLIGSRFADTLSGSAGDNRLDGGGGIDTLRGLGGNDTYYVDNAGDRVFEAAGGGTDAVASRVSYVLAAGQSVESLRFTTASGTTALDLTGNELAQTITGNAGANRLDGGAGADTLRGYGGDDTYYVDNAGDLVFELGGQGTDAVAARASFTLAAGQSVETLRAISATATTAINLTGNNLAQAVTGNAGNNILDGGAGNDTLRGYAGADFFRFATTLGASNVDHIADFSVPDDTIRLDRTIFTELDLGTLRAAAFKDIGVTGATVDGSDRILYDRTTGQLFYDADGSGATARVEFAVLDNKPTTLTTADFFVVA